MKKLLAMFAVLGLIIGGAAGCSKKEEPKTGGTSTPAPANGEKPADGE